MAWILPQISHHRHSFSRPIGNDFLSYFIVFRFMITVVNIKGSIIIFNQVWPFQWPILPLLHPYIRPIFFFAIHSFVSRKKPFRRLKYLNVQRYIFNFEWWRKIPTILFPQKYIYCVDKGSDFFPFPPFFSDFSSDFRPFFLKIFLIFVLFFFCIFIIFIGGRGLPTLIPLFSSISHWSYNCWFAVSPTIQYFLMSSSWYLKKGSGKNFQLESRSLLCSDMN